MTTFIVILAVAGVIWFIYAQAGKAAQKRLLERQEEAARQQHPSTPRSMDSPFFSPHSNAQDAGTLLRSFQMSPQERSREARRRAGL